MSYENNPWELYTSMPGWQEATIDLDKATTIALAQADVDIANGMTPQRAGIKVFDTVLPILQSYKRFGTCDLGVDDHLRRLINNHFKTNHSVL